MNTDAELPTPEPVPAVARPLAFKVIGVGETGCRVTSKLTVRALADVAFAGVDTDGR